MIAIQPKSRQILGVNQQTYQTLRASLSLNLRRQLLIAVCDDVSLQQRLANQLEADISKDSKNSKDSLESSVEGAHGLARIILDPDGGDLPQQVANWVRQTLLSQGLLSEALPAVQVLGIEQMTHQSAIAQHHFLRSLENVEALLPRLNTSLLVWLPWPWLRTIQQSSPTFWTWRSGVFEFASEYGSEYGSELASKYARHGGTSYDDEQAHADDGKTQISNLTHNLTTDNLTAGSSPESTAKSITAIDDSRLIFSGELGELGELYGESLESEAAPDADISLVHAVFDENLFENPVNAVRGAINAVDNGSDQESARLEESLEAIAPSSSIQTPIQTPVETLPETLLENLTSVDGYLAEGLDYRHQIESGVRDLALIESAILSYERGLSHLANSSLVAQPAGSSNHHAASIYLDWSSGLNDLGTLYWLKAQQLVEAQPSIDCMLHSILLYKEALKKITLAKVESASVQTNLSPASLAEQLYSNMGAVYSMLATYDEPIIYLQQAAAAYLNALLWVSVETAPKAYGILQNSLGSVYWYLSHYDQIAVNLNQAIAAYNQALLGYSPQQHPLDYAAVKNNLGITYWSLAKHEQPALYLNYAIAAYRDALNYRTIEVDPSACATTYNNLALAYWDLAKLDVNVIGLEQRVRYQKNAVAAFESVLKISQSTHTLSAADSAAVYHCLGDMHTQMATLATTPSEVASNLKKSLCSYVRAIEGLSFEAPAFQDRLAAIVANVKAHHQQLGLSGQQLALAQIPPALLSEILVAL